MTNPCDWADESHWKRRKVGLRGACRWASVFLSKQRQFLHVGLLFESVQQSARWLCTSFALWVYSVVVLARPATSLAAR